MAKARHVDIQPGSDDVADASQLARERRTIYKNLLSLCLGFLFVALCYQSIQSLQSTLNNADGLGTGTLTILYISFVISCVSVSPLIISLLGWKWTVAIPMLALVVYAIANLFATWYVLAPASVLIGMAAAPTWAAQSSYLTELAVQHAKATKERLRTVLSRFFGVFYLFHYSGYITGNMIGSTVLAREAGNITEDDLKYCGATFCPVEQEGNNTNLDRPSDKKVSTLIGIYIGSACLAFLLIALFLDKIKIGKEQGTTKDELHKKELAETGDNSNSQKFSARLLIKTLRFLWCSRSLKLLIPLTIYYGMEQAFVWADYTKSYIACAIGIWNVGYVLLCYGVVDAICCVTFGRLAQYVGHAFFFVLAGLLHLGVQITLLMWSPHPDAFVLFFILAALWGMGDAVLQIELNAKRLSYCVTSLYGSLFTHNREVAFANLLLWEAMGCIIAIAYGNSLCTNVKIYICMGVLVTGLLGYCMVNVLERRNHSCDIRSDDMGDKRWNGALTTKAYQIRVDIKKPEVFTKF